MTTPEPTLPPAPRFRCSRCGRSHAAEESEYACLACSPSGIVEPAHLPDRDEEELPSDEELEQEEWQRSLPFTRSPGIWRYERLLGLSLDAPRPPILVGATPLLHAQRLGRVLGPPISL